jgi:hypothetical protein
MAEMRACLQKLAQRILWQCHAKLLFSGLT